MSKKYATLVMNPNHLIDYKQNKPITVFNDFDSHCEYVWKNLISFKQFKNINIITFELASISLIKLMNKFSNDFNRFVNNISLINSDHENFYNILNNEMKLDFEKKVTNYMLSNEEAGTIIYKSLESGM